ncbi:MAG: hypothetical protein ACTHK0_13275 [Ginsengibacter sp.]
MNILAKVMVSFTFMQINVGVIAMNQKTALKPLLRDMSLAIMLILNMDTEVQYARTV